MNRFLPRWLNVTELRRLGGTYSGIIASVDEVVIHNRFTNKKQVEPVITFDDNYRLIPNLEMRHALIGRFGSDSETWCGQGVIVRCEENKRFDPATGPPRRATRHIAFADDEAGQTGASDEVDDEVPF